MGMQIEAADVIADWLEVSVTDGNERQLARDFLTFLRSEGWDVVRHVPIDWSSDPEEAADA